MQFVDNPTYVFAQGATKDEELMTLLDTLFQSITGSGTVSSS